jgi:hypothetical protein
VSSPLHLKKVDDSPFFKSWRKGTMTIEQMPTDVWVGVCNFCNAKDLSNLAGTNRFFLELVNKQWKQRESMLLSKDAETSYRKSKKTTEKMPTRSDWTSRERVIRCFLASSFAKRMEYQAYYHYEDLQCSRICSIFPDFETQCIRESNNFEFFVRFARRHDESLIAQGMCSQVPTMDRNVLYLDVYSLLKHDKQLGNSLEGLVKHCHTHHGSIVSSLVHDDDGRVEEEDEFDDDEPSNIHTTAVSSDTKKLLNNSLGNLAITVIALSTKSPIRTVPRLLVSTAGYEGLEVTTDGDIYFKMDARCTTPHNSNGQIYMGVHLNAPLPTTQEDGANANSGDLQYLRLETFDVHNPRGFFDEEDDNYDEIYQWESNPWEPTNFRQRQRDRRLPVNRARGSTAGGYRRGARRRRAPRAARALDGN